MIFSPYLHCSCRAHSSIYIIASRTWIHQNCDGLMAYTCYKLECPPLLSPTWWAQSQHGLTTSIAIIPRILLGKTTSWSLVDSWANGFGSKGSGPTLTTIFTKPCTCHYCEPRCEDRGFFFFTLFIFWLRWLTCGLHTNTPKTSNSTIGIIQGCNLFDLWGLDPL